MKRKLLATAAIAVFLIFLGRGGALRQCQAQPSVVSGEKVLLHLAFEDMPTGARDIPGLRGCPELPDVEVSESAHYSSARALKVVLHPENKKSHVLYFGPSLPVTAGNTVLVSARVKFEDVFVLNARDWLYPMLDLRIYDAKNKLIGVLSVVYRVKTTATESSADDNWIIFSAQQEIPKDASYAALSLQLYELEGQARGTVYLDDILVTTKPAQGQGRINAPK